MSSSRPVCSSSRNPAEGFAVVIILFSSVVILSADTIFILSALLLIDVSVLSAIRKSSCAANLYGSHHPERVIAEGGVRVKRVSG